MAKRSIAWEIGLARELRDPEFARGFIMACLEEEISIQEVLGKVIRTMGVKEFSKKVGLPSSNILRAIRPSHNPTMATINRLLKPFGLILTVTPQTRKRKPAA